MLFLELLYVCASEKTSIFEEYLHQQINGYDKISSEN